MICQKCEQDLPPESFRIIRRNNRPDYTYKKCRKCIADLTKHNSRHVAFQCWRNAKRRCEDPQHPAFRHYGARGILFKLDYKEFCKTFEHAIEILLNCGLRPSIDRVDPHGHYEMSNIRMMDHRENAKRAALHVHYAFRKKRPQHRVCKECKVKFPLTDKHFMRVGVRSKIDGQKPFSRMCRSCFRTKKRAQAHARGYWDHRDKAKKGL